MSQFALLEPERDPRGSEGMSNLDALRRIDLWRLADRLGVPYPNGATANDMRDILRAMPHIESALGSTVKKIEESHGDEDRPLVDVFMEQFHKNPDVVHGKREDNQDDMLLSKMRVPELRAEAKRRGISLPRNVNRVQALAALGVENGADVSSSDE